MQFGSLDPAAIDDKFIKLVGAYTNIHPYFHFSIQSGDNMILKRMGRRHSREDVINLCQKLRAVRPDSTFGADFICGFPTETEENFINTINQKPYMNLIIVNIFNHIHRFQKSKIKYFRSYILSYKTAKKTRLLSNFL